MSKDLVVEPGDEQRAPGSEHAEIERLEQELARCRRALEEIRDHPFEQSNSPRLTDQLWHFVRWSKSIARSALERGDDSGDDKP